MFERERYHTVSASGTSDPIHASVEVYARLVQFESYVKTPADQLGLDGHVGLQSVQRIKPSNGMCGFILAERA